MLEFIVMRRFSIMFVLASCYYLFNIQLFTEKVFWVLFFLGWFSFSEDSYKGVDEEDEDEEDETEEVGTEEVGTEEKRETVKINHVVKLEFPFFKSKFKFKNKK